MALIPVEEARARILKNVKPLPAEAVTLEQALGRVLAKPLKAVRNQPPFDASAMDGYAVISADVAHPPATLRLIGLSAAGHGFKGRLKRGDCVRIFTGAPVPKGADAVVIQENTRRDGTVVVVAEGTPESGHVRRRGFDFAAGDALLTAGRRLGPRELSLAAAMGHGEIAVRRAPRVAVLATGDELVLPGETPGPGQIVCSNHLGVAALCRQAGAVVRFLGFARDTTESLDHHIAAAADADVLVTIGGASVGDHDLVGPVLRSRGMALDFWNIAMRPGKPLMFGKLGTQRVLGLPGNPVSSLVCARVFVVPLIASLLGHPSTAETLETVPAGAAIERNGSRQHYMRATVRPGPDGRQAAHPARSQDSSLLSPLAESNAFIVRPIDAPAVAAGGDVQILRLDF